jgi:hypothetical protein
MLKRIGFVLALIAAMAITSTALAQAPTPLPPPRTRTRINFAPGTSAYTLTTYLALGESQGFVLRVAAGQKMYVTKMGNASVVVLDPQDVVLIGATSAVGPWGFWTTKAGDYTVVLSGEAYVFLTIYIPPLGSNAQTPVPLPFYRQRIRFAPGSTGYYLSQDLAQGQPAAFTLGISAGQQLNVWTKVNVTVALLDLQDDALLPVIPSPAQYQFSIPQTGDYTLVLLGSGTVSVFINIPPLTGSPPPPQGAQRVVFAPGTDSTTIYPDLVPGTGQSYVLGISRGQTLYVFTSEGTTFVVYDPQGNRIAYSNWWGGFTYNIVSDGDYTVTFYGQGPASIRFQIPPL